MADKELSRKVISRLIKKDGRSLTEIAGDLNVSRQRLGQYQNGKRFPDADFIQKWAKKFGHNLMELMENETGKETNVSQETGKPTSVQNEPAVSQKPLRAPEEVYRNLVEANSEYRLVPKVILEGKYVMVLESEIGKTEAALWETIRSKNDLIKDLKEEIAIYRASRTPTEKRE